MIISRGDKNIIQSYSIYSYVGIYGTYKIYIHSMYSTALCENW